ncbi:MAG: glycosyltransferase family 2 protein [Candidatus Eisenbacteria bacterium]|nr:glycosyltransferase family 2 protein [Candidatus Eisenbacteria bacterium]
MATVSVLVPLCNRRELALEAIESVLAQTFRDFELVIADDGSCDGTPLALFSRLGAEPKAIRILSGMMSAGALQPFSHVFSHEDIRVQYHFLLNRGLSAARNRGLRQARGEYLAFLEPEYIWDPTHLETLVGHCRAHPTVKMCHVGERSTKEKGRARRFKTTPESSGGIFEQAITAAPFAISSMLAHRSCFAECGGFDENLPSCEDYDILLRLTARNQVSFVDGETEVLKRMMRAENPSRGWKAERYRVYALEKSFQSGHLNADQRLLVAEEILRKCERLVEGYRRKEGEERASFYDRKRRRFAQEVRKLRASAAAVQ